MSTPTTRFDAFVAAKGIHLAVWQRAWAHAYLKGEYAAILMPFGRGAGKTFIWKLMEEFVESGGLVPEVKP